MVVLEKFRKDFLFVEGRLTVPLILRVIEFCLVMLLLLFDHELDIGGLRVLFVRVTGG